MIVSRAALALAAILSSLLLQGAVLDPLVFPVPVSLPIMMVVAVGCYAGTTAGIGLGFATGVFADLSSDHPVGVLALCWMLAGMWAGLVGGLVLRRGYGTRGSAAALAGVATVATVCSTAVLTVLASHGAGFTVAIRDLPPTFLGDLLVGLIAVPLVRRLLRAQGIRPPREGGGRALVLRAAKEDDRAAA